MKESANVLTYILINIGIKDHLQSAQLVRPFQLRGNMQPSDKVPDGTVDKNTNSYLLM